MGVDDLTGASGPLGDLDQRLAFGGGDPGHVEGARVYACLVEHLEGFCNFIHR